MKLILIILLTPFIIFGQYSKNDSLLVHTTFTREFNKEIINGYLNSSEPQQVKAALLSISHSNDTSYVKDAIKLDYEKFSDEICFALGQLGPYSNSEDFLLSKLENNSLSSPLLQALGKCGSEKSFNVIVSKYNENFENLDGISLALFYFL